MVHLHNLVAVHLHNLPVVTRPAVAMTPPRRQSLLELLCYCIHSSSAVTHLFSMGHSCLVFPSHVLSYTDTPEFIGHRGQISLYKTKTAGSSFWHSVETAQLSDHPDHLLVQWERSSIRCRLQSPTGKFKWNSMTICRACDISSVKCATMRGFHCRHSLTVCLPM